MKSNLSSIKEIITDLSKGKMVVIVDDEDRENEGDLIFCASQVNPEKINFMAKHARGLICLALDKSRFKKLNLKLMTDQNLSRHRTAFTISIEARKGITTGISAKDRAETIRVAVSPKSTSKDLVSPGHIFPILSSDGGVLERAGHTEAAVDLSRLAIGDNSPYGVICEIMNDDGSMARMKDLVKFCKKHNLRMSSIKDLIEYKLKQDKFVKCIKVDEVMLNKSIFKMYVYKNLIDKTEHLAFVKGIVDSKKNILVRMHSFNIFSDLLSDKTSELQKSISIISKSDSGAIVIIRNPKKELNKRNSNNKNFNKDKILKEYGVGAQILIDLGIRKITLLTKSRKNIVGIDGFGLEVNGTKRF